MSRTRIATQVVPAALALLAVTGCAEVEPGEVRVLEDARAVEFEAVVTSDAFDAEGDMSGYHLIVWENGSAVDAALLRATVSDVQVLEAIESLGAEPGNGLSIDTWEERHDPDHPAPYATITGPPVRILIRASGQERWLTLEDVLEDPGGEGFEMRFGGHRANIPEWHSGCVVCLFSCPGSKVGNAAYTVHDYVQGATRFRPREGVLPADGGRVIVRLTLPEAGT